MQIIMILYVFFLTFDSFIANNCSAFFLFFVFVFLFQGLENCFIWDDKHGFGFNKDGEVVIVTPNTLPTHSVFNSENFKQMCE